MSRRNTTVQINEEEEECEEVKNKHNKYAEEEGREMVNAGVQKKRQITQTQTDKEDAQSPVDGKNDGN